MIRNIISLTLCFYGLDPMLSTFPDWITLPYSPFMRKVLLLLPFHGEEKRRRTEVASAAPGSEHIHFTHMQYCPLRMLPLPHCH